MRSIVAPVAVRLPRAMVAPASPWSAIAPVSALSVRFDGDRLSMSVSIVPANVMFPPPVVTVVSNGSTVSPLTVKSPPPVT